MAEDPSSPGQFPETRWTLIQSAGSDDRSLHEWCRGYWLPVRNYICAQGRTQDEANDLTQEFFERLLRKDRKKMLPTELSGAFRAYLKRSVKNFLIDQWRSSHTQRRGAGQTHLELDEERAPSEAASADQAFDRAWVIAVLENAMNALEREMEHDKKNDLFQALAPFVDGSEPNTSQADIATQLGMSSGAVRVALHRLRQRFRHHIEEELRQTVSTKSEFEEEIRNLLAIWS